MQTNAQSSKWGESVRLSDYVSLLFNFTPIMPFNLTCLEYQSRFSTGCWQCILRRSKPLVGAALVALFFCSSEYLVLWCEALFTVQGDLGCLHGEVRGMIPIELCQEIMNVVDHNFYYVSFYEVMVQYMVDKLLCMHMPHFC